MQDIPIENVYSNGTFGSGWNIASYGTAADIKDTELTAEAIAFAAFILEASPPFNASAYIFDAKLKGSVLTRSAVRLEDSRGKRESTDIPLYTINGSSGPTARLLGPDNDGWHTLQINLGQLVQNTAQPSSPLSPDLWNRIVFQDISGVGFTLVLKSADLVPVISSSSEGTNGTTNSSAACVGQACNPILEASSVQESLVPLYGGDVVASDLNMGPSEVIAYLTPGTTLGDVAALCAELAGTLDTPDKQARFNGSCSFGVAPQDTLSIKDIEAPVKWPFLSIAAESEADLLAMRALLKDRVTYFDRNKMATVNSSRRFLRDEMDENLTDLLPSAPEAETDGGFSVEDACASVPWNLDRIDQPSQPLDGRFDPGYTGAGVHIYSLDTGARVTHTEFTGRVGQTANCVSGGSPVCRTDLPVTDGNGHGTHVAALAAGTCYGVAKGATIHPVKTMSDNGSGSYSSIIAGLQWVLQDVAQNGYWPAVVSMSLGGDFSQSLNDAVATVVSAGIPVAVAAGNEYGADACTKSPASAPSALTVASSDREDKASPFSNIGTCVDIWAPGSQIVSASNADDTSSRQLSGTSMATPQVAGAAALVLQPNPKATPQQVQDTLNSAAVKIDFVSGTTTEFLQTTPSGLAG